MSEYNNMSWKTIDLRDHRLFLWILILLLSAYVLWVWFELWIVSLLLMVAVVVNKLDYRWIVILMLSIIGIIILLSLYHYQGSKVFSLLLFHLFWVSFLGSLYSYSSIEHRINKWIDGYFYERFNLILNPIFSTIDQWVILWQKKLLFIDKLYHYYLAKYQTSLIITLVELFIVSMIVLWNIYRWHIKLWVWFLDWYIDVEWYKAHLITSLWLIILAYYIKYLFTHKK